MLVLTLLVPVLQPLHWMDSRLMVVPIKISVYK